MRNIVYISFSLTTFFSNQAFSHKLGDVSKHMMSYKSAIKYCSDQGTRLPTIRELAEYATSLGATGIRETQFPDAHVSSPEVINERNQNDAEGFEAIIKKTRTSSGYPYATTAFYYSRNGFKPEDPYSYNETLWSMDLTFWELIYVLSQWGHIWDKGQIYGVAFVRCVK